MSHQITLTVGFKVAWWLRFYLHGVAFACWLSGREPDMDKIGRWIDRGIKPVVERG